MHGSRKVFRKKKISSHRDGMKHPKNFKTALFVIYVLCILNSNATNQMSDVCPSVGRSIYVARDKHQYYNYCFLMFRSGCCTKCGVNVAVGIFIIESDVRIVCIHVF
jgi:hypothetical protein